MKLTPEVDVAFLALQRSLTTQLEDQLVKAMMADAEKLIRQNVHQMMSGWKSFVETQYLPHLRATQVMVTIDGVRESIEAAKKARQDSELADKNKKADIPEQRGNNLYAPTALHKLGTVQPPVDQEDARRRHEEALRRCVQHQEGMWDQNLTTRYYSGELITQEEYVRKAREMGYEVRVVDRDQMPGY